MKKILVSQCLYGGTPVRYDGKSKAEDDLRFLQWKEEGRLIPVCPEVFGGLPVPRADAQRQGDRIVARTGKDVTKEYMKGAEEAVRLAKANNVICAVMKEKSPSCGSNKIYDGTFEGILIEGQGLAVELLRKAGVTVFSEEELDKVAELIEDAERNEAIIDKSNILEDKKVIIFDMDGTLIDSVGIWNEVDRKLIDTLWNKEKEPVIDRDKTVHKISEEDIQKERDEALRQHRMASDPYGEYCRILKKRYGMKETIEEIIKIRYEIAQHYLKDIIGYKEGAAEFIKKLKEAGMTLVIASTTKKSNMEIYKKENANINAKAPIDEYFSLVYTREDVEEIKPSSEVYIKVMETLGAKASECLVFEDSLVGVEAAKAAGIQTVAVYDRYSDGDRKQIDELADLKIKDYREVIGRL